MQYTRLGRTGLSVSRLCLGTMTFGWSTEEAAAFDIMDAALEAGINFFDTADIYSFWIDGNEGGESERIIGKWLKGKARRDVIIATKVRGRMWDGPNGEGLSRYHIIQAVEDSLKRLQTDYIDLYQVHFPDDETPLGETLSALDTMVQSGKVRYIGASNYPAWLLTKTLWVSDVNNLSRFDSLQPHYSLLHRDEFERELADLCVDQGIGVIPYSPLAAGFLTGKYTRDNADEIASTRSSGDLIQGLLQNNQSFKVLDILKEIAETHGGGVNTAQVALSWLLEQAAVSSPIIGARTLEQFQQVVGAADLTLAEDELIRLDDASKGF